MRGDLVVTLDGQSVTGVDDLIRLLNADRIGRTIAVDVIRLGRMRRFDLAPAERKSTRAK
jgi:S1-C subfamily serine protease